MAAVTIDLPESLAVELDNRDVSEEQLQRLLVQAIEGWLESEPKTGPHLQYNIESQAEHQLLREGLQQVDPSGMIKARAVTQKGISTTTVSVLDVAEYILEKQGAMTTMKLQKLVYYSQAWSLVWDEEPLFEEPIEAWANGPIVRKLFEAHRGYFKIYPGIIKGNPHKLNITQRETIDAVLESYGPRTSQWLSDLTHSERPWLEARWGMQPGERGSRIISLEAIAEFYEAAASNGVAIESLGLRNKRAA